MSRTQAEGPRTDEKEGAPLLFHRKKKDYFGDKIETDCAYCRFGSDFDGAVVCKVGLDLEPDGSCRKFSYDPLKRKPFAPPPLREYDPDDFKL